MGNSNANSEGRHRPIDILIIIAGLVLFLFNLSRGQNATIKRYIPPSSNDINLQIKPKRLREMVKLAEGGWFFFETDQLYMAKVPNVVEEQYANILQAVRQSPSVKMVIIGYTEPRYSFEYSIMVGSMRADNVAKYFSEKFGIPRNRIIAESKGNLIEPRTIDIYFAGAQAIIRQN